MNTETGRATVHIRGTATTQPAKQENKAVAQVSQRQHRCTNSSARNVFDRKFVGHQLSRAIDMHDREFRKFFGPHNLDCLVFRDDNDQLIGCRLPCECYSCLCAMTCFCLDNQCDLIALGANSYDVIRTSENACELRQRRISVLEEELRAERENERQHVRAMFATLLHLLREEQREQFKVATGGGTVKDRNGRTWTRAELMAMCTEQQLEDVATRKTLDPALVEALKAKL